MIGIDKALLTEKDLHGYQQFCVDFVPSFWIAASARR